jgi:hypothetical protein
MRKKVDKMTFNKQDYLTKLNKLIEIRMGKFSEKERSYVRVKGENIFDLFVELESKDMLKSLSRIEAETVSKNLDKSLGNIDHMGKLYVNLINMVESVKDIGNQTVLELFDKKKNSYKITTNQFVILIGFTFCSLCEFTKLLLSDVIEFDSRPTGLGNLKKQLEDEGIQRLEFFNDLDIDIRNTFFHFDFKIEKDGIHYGNGKTIKLHELIQLVLKADRSATSLMMMCNFYLRSLYPDIFSSSSRSL